MLPEEREPVSLRGVIIQPLGVPSDGPLCSLWRGTDFLDAGLKSVTVQYNYIFVWVYRPGAVTWAQLGLW